jgi:Tfp pilus assembly protein PilO
VNRRGPLLIGIGSVVLVALAVFLLVLPKSSKIAETTEEIATAEQQEQSLRVQLQALQEAQAAAPQTKREIAKVETLVPSTADLPGLIRMLREAADRAAVDLFQFSPGTPTADASGEFSTIPTSVNVTGSYFSLDEFLYRLEALPRAAKVTNVSVSAGGESGGAETSTGTTASTGTTTTAIGGQTPLTLQLTVEFYTSDLSAGPGSVPGPTDSATGA